MSWCSGYTNSLETMKEGGGDNGGRGRRPWREGVETMEGGGGDHEGRGRRQ